MGLAKAFIAVNRIFGWGAAIAGALMLVESVMRLALGQAGGSRLALVGIPCLAMGIVYIRAPLFRKKRESPER